MLIPLAWVGWGDPVDEVEKGGLQPEINPVLRRVCPHHLTHGMWAALLRHCTEAAQRGEQAGRSKTLVSLGCTQHGPLDQREVIYQSQ